MCSPFTRVSASWVTGEGQTPTWGFAASGPSGGPDSPRESPVRLRGRRPLTQGVRIYASGPSGGPDSPRESPVRLRGRRRGGRCPPARLCCLPSAPLAVDP
jgi:hypothetical protein